MAQRNPGLCQDNVLSQIACPKFCKMCPLECFHCEVSVRDYMDCYMITTCDVNQQCMLQKLHSSRDGHDEYVMGCASPQLARDIVLIVEDAGDKTSQHTNTNGDYSTPYITAFLKELVSRLPICTADSLVELSLADSGIHSVWTLADYMTNDSLQTAIDGIPFRHRQDNLDINGIVNYVSKEAFSIRSGDMLNVSNAIVIFVDNRARPSTTTGGQVNGIGSGAQHHVQQASGDVIIVNIGPPDHSDVTKMSVLATDASHVLSVADYDALSGIKETLVNRICN